MLYITQINIKDVVMTMVQIAGLCCIVHGMNVIDNKIYTLQRVCRFDYPSTECEVKGGDIKKNDKCICFGRGK